jgi:nucleotidyltransferase substrate binding protein (TIGR01987 family)
MQEDVRWLQRYQNFSNALKHLEAALSIQNPDYAQKAGIVQFFEMSYELAWKTLKDYLEYQGFLGFDSPRAVIKKAFEQDLIENGQQWMNVLQDRNLTTHIYDEAKIIEIIELVRENYLPLFIDLWKSLQLKKDKL